MQTSQEHFTTIVYAKFGGQTECIMGNWKGRMYRACSTFRNTGTPEHHGTFRNNRKTGTPPKKPGTLPRKPGTPQENPEHSPKSPEHPKKTRDTPKKNEISKKQMAHQCVTVRGSFSELLRLIAYKII